MTHIINEYFWEGFLIFNACLATLYSLPGQGRYRRQNQQHYDRQDRPEKQDRQDRYNWQERYGRQYDRPYQQPQT